MENVEDFLESSTIHGLAYIATGRNYIRILWMSVVIAGFTGAGVMIHQAFQDWNESPVKTTIETLPITEITFPKVTVCPPKNTYTDLNYDLMMTENMTLDNFTIHELENYVAELLYDDLHKEIMRNISKIQDNERYYNWYHGYSQINLPSPSSYGDPKLGYQVDTSAASGIISTQHFGDKFDVKKVETRLNYQINVHTPESVRNNPNVTFHFQIDKVSMENFGYEEFWHSANTDNEIRDKNSYIAHTSENFTAPELWSYYIRLIRAVSGEDVRKQKLNLMPGFRVKWYFSGIEVESVAKYNNKLKTMAFVRNVP